MAFSQVYNGKGLFWESVQNPDTRVSIKFVSTGRNIGGYEGTTVIIKNLTSQKIFIELKLLITDYCGKEIIRSIKAAVKENGSIGGSTWMGGNEQYDFSTACKERKLYGGRFYSYISKATLQIISIREDGIGSGGAGSRGTGSGSGNSNGGQDNSNSSGGSSQNYYDDIKKKKNPSDNIGVEKKDNDNYWETTGANNKSNNTNTSCPPQDLGLANNPSMNCIQLRWFSQSTIQFNDKTNELKTTNVPTDFILSYKKASDIYWKDIKLNGYHLSYYLPGLEPCNQYEVRLQRDCGNNSYSAWSNSLRFTTTCPIPSMVKASAITATSASIGSRFSPGINICAGTRPKYTLNIEYAAVNSNWQTVYANPGTGGSVLYNLTPNTAYRVRIRYDYENGNYSNYSNEILLKTRPN